MSAENVEERTKRILTSVVSCRRSKKHPTTDFIKSSVSSDPSRLVALNDQRLSRKYSHNLWWWSERDLVPKTLQAMDKGLGKAWCTKPLVVICAEFAERAVVLE